MTSLKNAISVTAAAFATLLFGIATAGAQPPVTFSRVVGIVLSADSIAVPGAKVALTGERFDATVITTSTGEFAFGSVPAGRFLVRVISPDSARVQTEQIVVGNGASAVVQIVLPRNPSPRFVKVPFELGDPIPGDTLKMHSSISDAESEGRLYRRMEAPASLSPAPPFLGETERRCVFGRVGVPSGEILPGDAFNFLNSTAAMRVHWRLRFQPSSNEQRLIIRAARLGAPSDTLRITRSFQAIASNSAGETTRFFTSALLFPRSGLWLLLVTSGPNWGCFIVDVS